MACIITMSTGYVNIVQVVRFLIVQGFYQQSAYNPHQKSLKHLCTSLVTWEGGTKGSKIFQSVSRYLYKSLACFCCKVLHRLPKVFTFQQRNKLNF